MEYTALSATERLSMVRARILDLERSYQQLSLRLEAPNAGELVNEQDNSNLAVLESSLNKLHELESQLANPSTSSASS